MLCSASLLFRSVIGVVNGMSCSNTDICMFVCSVYVYKLHTAIISYVWDCTSIVVVCVRMN